MTEKFPISAPNGRDTISPGRKEEIEIELESILGKLDRCLDELGVDRRAAMPNQELSHEYRLREARATLQELQNDFINLEEEP